MDFEKISGKLAGVDAAQYLSQAVAGDAGGLGTPPTNRLSDDRARTVFDTMQHAATVMAAVRQASPRTRNEPEPGQAR